MTNAEKDEREAEKDAGLLTARERIALAHAVYRLTGYPEPKGEFDLSSVRNPVERVVEDILATRIIPPAEKEKNDAYRRE